MIPTGWKFLHGRVEIDYIYVGTEEEGSKGRKIVKKALIIIIVEEMDGKNGRTRLFSITNALEENMVPFTQDNIDPGNMVNTDCWKRHYCEGEKGYRGVVWNIEESGIEASDLLPNVFLVTSLARCRLMGAY